MGAPHPASPGIPASVGFPSLRSDLARRLLSLYVYVQITAKNNETICAAGVEPCAVKGNFRGGLALTTSSYSD